MFKFITHRPLWLNFLIGISLAVGIFALFLLSLDWITGHGKSATVPSLIGKKADLAIATLKKAGFEVEVQDSVYIDTMPPLSVIKQFPEADEVVKQNRTVFLVLNKKDPPVIDMPNLVGYSFRNAELVLRNMGLKFGDTTFRPDFARNAVLEQLYNGAPIAPGTKIRKGHTISLVLGDGIGTREFTVPTIAGMTYCDAKTFLEDNGVVIGAVILNPDVKDTCNAYIFQQKPERFDDQKKLQMIRSGQTIDVWLQKGKIIKDSTNTEDLYP